jgi:beta-glucosidase
VNYYTRRISRSQEIPEEENEPREVYPNPDPTEMGWEVYPLGLLETLARINFNYNFPKLYITENGAAYDDSVGEDGHVNDPLRVKYLQSHFKSVSKAIKMGVPVKGYFVWSLLDNFEWAHGYSKRFGLIFVDYGTQDRVLKDSAWYFKEVIKTNQVLEKMQE